MLSYVAPDKAAAVIEQLEGRRQIKVVESMAQMDSASPTAIKIIETEMQKRFDNIFVTNNNVKVGGIDFVASVMNNIDRSSEKSIFDGLSSRNEELAEEIRKRMFVFEDIVTMDDRSVQRFVRDCDPKDLVLALKAANQEVANKLFGNMSSRMAESIRDDLEITLKGRPARAAASQGQQRSLALALQLAGGERLRRLFGEFPVLLLDDVFSELDADRRRALGELVRRADQAILAAPNPDEIPFGADRTLLVESGRITEL